MWRSSTLSGVARTAVCVASLQSLTFLKVTNCSKAEEAKKTEKLGAYLTPQSKELLKKFLNKNGINNTNINHVCMSDEMNDEEAYVYRPLFGSKVGFRVKGIITDKTGDVTVVGRVSTFNGELKHENFIANLPIEKKVDKSNNFWKLSELANVPGNVDNSATCKPILPVNQIVLEGKLCSDKYFDGNGNCLYDEKLHGETNKSKYDKTKKKQKTAIPSPKQSTGDNKDECPLCVYMKKGPCKDDFIAWQNCLDQVEDNDLTTCSDVTSYFLKCMQGNEYYDFMSAGIDMAQYEEVWKDAEERRHNVRSTKL